MQVITLVLLDLGKRTKVRQIIEHMWFQRKALLNGRNGNLSNTARQLCNPIQFPSR